MSVTGFQVSPRRRRALREMDLVRLARDLTIADGQTVPRGTQATVLQVFRGGEAYQVEFEGPFEVPETVLAADLARDDAAS